MLAAPVWLFQAAFSLRPFWSLGGADASCKRPRVSGRGFGRAYKSTTRNELDKISLGPATISERLEVRLSRMTFPSETAPETSGSIDSQSLTTIVPLDDFVREWAECDSSALSKVVGTHLVPKTSSGFRGAAGWITGRLRPLTPFSLL